MLIEQLYDEYHRLMFSIARKYALSEADAEDIVSDSFVSLLDALCTLRTLSDENKIRKYIATTVRNTGMNYLVQHRKEDTFFVQLDEVAPHRLPASDSTVKKIMVNEETEFCRTAIRTLPIKEQQALLLRCVFQKTDGEIAKTIGISEASVRKYIQRARQKLTKIMYGVDHQNE